MRRYLQVLAGVAVVAAVLWPTAAQAEDLVPGVEHRAATAGPNRIDVVYVHPTAAVQIKAIVPFKPGGATPEEQCMAMRKALQGCLAIINADFFHDDGWPDGGMVSDGQVLKLPMVPRSDRQQLSLNSAMQFITGSGWPADVQQSTGASYTLLAANKAQPPQVAPENDFHGLVNGNHARTLICWNQYNGDKLFVTISGKQAGVSLAQAAQIGHDVGATDCVNMDGGSSTMMAIGGQRVSPLENSAHKVHNFWVVMGPPLPPQPQPVAVPRARLVAKTTAPPPSPTTVPPTPPQPQPPLPAPELAVSVIGPPTDAGTSPPVGWQTTATALMLIAVSISYSRRKLLEQSLFRLYNSWRVLSQ